MKKLKETHKTHIKFEKLCDCLDELGLSISTDHAGRLVLVDKDFNNGQTQIIIKDAEDDNQFLLSSPSLPPEIEYKLVINDG